MTTAKKPTKPVPRVKFCWHCSRKLVFDGKGWHYETVNVDGIERIVHVCCKKSVLDDPDYNYRFKTIVKEKPKPYIEEDAE